MGRIKKPKPIGPSQWVARRILIFFCDLLFFAMRSLRHPQPPEFEQPCVIALFHDELLPLCSYFRHSDFAAIASQNHVGYAIAKSMEKIGFQVALGSPSRGGQDAFFQLIKLARQQRTIAFAVDGSRGPRHVMKPGALMLARKARLPLILMRADYRGWRIENSWDKTKIPHPFGEVRILTERFHWEDMDPETPLETLVEAAQQQLRDLLPDDYRAEAL